MTPWPARPQLSHTFFKGHGLGNDYLVFDEVDDPTASTGWPATPENVRRVCDRHRGVGGDGIVVILTDPDGAGGAPDGATLRMFNPDGGEFERSGNGLRILAMCLARRHPGLRDLLVHVGGDEVEMTVHGLVGSVYDVSVQMGRARTGASAVQLDERALDSAGRISVGKAAVDVTPVSVGNPHLVVVRGSRYALDEAELAELGPALATHPALAAGANVQIATPVGAASCDALVWERGVGRTAASGTSACAVAVALVSKRVLEPGEITVTMPGGVLLVSVSADLDVVLRGPVEEICEGSLTDAFVAAMS